MQLTLEVAPYVYHYLVAQYGVGPYELKSNRDLLTSFMYWDVKAHAQIPPIQLNHTRITIVLEFPEKDKRLVHVANMVKATPIRHTFFVSEFWQAAIMYICGQIDASGTSRWVALEKFLERCGISEEVYPIDTAYRMLTRYMEARPYTLAAVI